ncbi:hypothetical protein [Streptomyces sp. NPDC051211]|uniref:hypothetical protein n=1 Tax=Streptomyces sp. NPDC051211 TaxID=3154643 RepID=UPI00344BB61A
MGQVRRPPGARRAALLSAALLSAALLLTLAACTGEDDDRAADAPSASFTANGVAVTLRVTAWDGRHGTLTADFVPQEPGFHLYSVDLPPEGIDGIGRPTSVAVLGSLRAHGKLTADAPVRRIPSPGTEETLPVYPDGPVTTTLPLTADGPGPASVSVGYALCNATEGCMLPVDDHRVPLTVTEQGISFTGN